MGKEKEWKCIVIIQERNAIPKKKPAILSETSKGMIEISDLWSIFLKELIIAKSAKPSI